MNYHLFSKSTSTGLATRSVSTGRATSNGTPECRVLPTWQKNDKATRWVIGCLGVWGLSGRGLGDTFLSKMGVWRTLGGDMGDLEGPGGTQRVKSINFGSHFGTLLRAKMGVKNYQKLYQKPMAIFM